LRNIQCLINTDAFKTLEYGREQFRSENGYFNVVECNHYSNQVLEAEQ